MAPSSPSSGLLEAHSLEQSRPLAYVGGSNQSYAHAHARRPRRRFRHGGYGRAVVSPLQKRRRRQHDARLEFGSKPLSRDEAPAPARAGKVLAAKLIDYDVPIEQAGRLANVMHWGYGPAWGAQFALVAAMRRQQPSRRSALAFGTVVWASDYVTLRPLGCLSAHLALPTKGPA